MNSTTSLHCILMSFDSLSGWQFAWKPGVRWSYLYLLTENITCLLWSMDIMHDYVVYVYIYIYVYMFLFSKYQSRSRSYEIQTIIHTNDTLYYCIIVKIWWYQWGTYHQPLASFCCKIEHGFLTISIHRSPLGSSTLSWAWTRGNTKFNIVR